MRTIGPPTRLIQAFLALATVTFMSMAAPTTGQTLAQSRSLVIEGGTLIDGTGRAVRKNSLIIIQNNRIEAVSEQGQLSIPEGAEIIRAEGQFILPGLIDMHIHYAGNAAELMIGHGITSIFDTSVSAPKTAWMVAQRDGVAKGKIRGPRVFWGAWMDGPPTPGRNAGPGHVFHRRYARTPEQARQIVKDRAASGLIDGIKLYWNTTLPLMKAFADEAHKANLPVSIHVIDATSDAREMVEAGADVLIHSSGICLANIQDPEKRKRFQEYSLPEVPTGAFPNYVWVEDPSNQACHLMEPEVFDETIEFLVSHNVSINPTNAFGWRCVHGRQADFDQQVLKLCRNPELGYISKTSCNVKWLGNIDAGCIQLTENELENMNQGYQKLKEFLRKFVDAGGRVLPGSDASGSGVTGLGLHQELQLLTDAGISPMDAIVSTTKHSAEYMRQGDELGTVEAGKLADIIIVAEDPLADIRNLMKITKVIQNGRVLDHSYHRDWKNPIPSAGGGMPRDVLLGVTQRISSISPSVVIEGQGGLTLTVKGNNFYRNSTVQFGDERLSTRFINVMELEAEVPARLIQHTGMFSIAVTTSTMGGRDQVTRPRSLIVKFK